MNNLDIEYYNLTKRSSYYAITTVILILIAKFYAWFNTNSIAIFASLLDSFFDLSGCLVNLFALKYSSIPPDDNHRFGHNKIEDMAVFAQSMFFMGSSVFMLFNCIDRVLNPETLSFIDLGIHVMIFSICMNLLLVLYQSYVFRKTKAGVVEVDKFHFIVDAMTSIATLIALFLAKNFPHADVLCGSLVSFYMFYGSYKILRKSLKNLLDEECSKEEKEEILDIIASNKEVQGIHELKTRNAGHKKFIQFHIELDPNMQLLTAHEISDSIMQQLQNRFPESEVIIHQDPAGVEVDVNYKENLKNKA